ncbi:hypothetical protein NQ317_014753 [Molorchus minor]|uniref:ZZ-type zinc finger-containing protein 3 n=1 Tax=Molorchus minor TaxID=1323400 RepID=A0ABQ9J217_9CUCU|nr:hypothetical protein NQ317_014753 [Molorchus minor]
MANNLNSPFIQEDDLFFFETDHLALKGNKDYCEVLKTLDFNQVVKIHKEALDNPLEVLEKIKNGSDLEIPPLAELPKIPVINFNKFDIPIPEDELKIIYSDSVNIKSEDDVKNMKQSHHNSRAWTPEEQKRLEELLVVYPPEPIEMRRFQKIAKALGNRTVQQVTSRVQKYFLKLYKAGLPIPGRIPKSSEKYKKSVLHKHQRHNHYLWKPTTFFPDLYVPVMMNDLDNIPGPSINTSSPSTSTSGSSNYLLPTEYHHNNDICSTKSESELQLGLLKRIRMEKLREQDGNHSSFQHIGFKCDYCDAEPIIGPRWHCTTCTNSVDYCMDCVLSQVYSDNAHPLHHKMTIFYSETESHSTPVSDSESYSGSANTKNYESDSNHSEDFDNEYNVLKYEVNDVNLDNNADYNLNLAENDYKSMKMEMNFDFE